MERSKIPALKSTPGPSSSQTIVSGQGAIKKTNNINLQSRQHLLRRSKSFSDLRSAMLKPELLSKAPLRRYGIAQALVKCSSNTDGTNASKKVMPSKAPLSTVVENRRAAPVPSKTAVKRPAPLTTAHVNAKVAKPMKPAPYDYKARFQLLTDKYTDLQQKLKDNNEKILVMEKNVEAYEVLKSDHIMLQQQNLALAEETELTKEKHAELTTSHNKLVEEYDIVVANSKVLEKENTELKNNLEELETKHVSLVNKHTNLEQRLQAAEMEIEELKNSLQQYKTEILSHEELRRVMHNQIQDMKGTIRVFCRVRPSLPNEQCKTLCSINYIDEATLEIKKSKENINQITGKSMDNKSEFTFDKVFPAEATQAEIFDELSQLVQSALDGYHICVFAYGQTGSGKTYTMQGENSNEQTLGMIPRTVTLIFKMIESLKKLGWIYKVKANFLEIYNESIRDLLNPNDKGQHDIYFNEGKGITVTNITTKIVESADALQNLMNVANKNRAVAVTNYNEHSSRSHAITKIMLEGTNAEMGTCYAGSLNLVDLAGSESAKNSTNERITETKNINKSLSTLGIVMSALYNKEQYIPYRNSKLTYLLHSCLAGNSKTLMIVNIAPLEDNYNESLNALRFATTAKDVKIGSRKNKTYLKRELSNVVD